MDIREEKLSLVKRLLDVDKEITLERIKDILDEEQNDFWSRLDKSVQESIERALDQAEKGQFRKHDEVMSKYIR
ncbi:MAG: hypothetical protein HWE07_08845 [Cytophagia bacterium]|nr:hypothetical protein [Cytophagia bacterium]